ncbi:MAG: hypothetical protein RR776_00055 [Niameybacter sp.]|uniref:alanyl-tRNA editing protein n=1 Tax=Niameybacter sp. TaxID=2033640 RepID=UPI002FC83F90
MTELIYYNNPEVTTFNARVLACDAVEGIYKILLDQTAFFPGGGGQPGDHGTLNGLEVLGFIEEEGAVYHQLRESLEVDQVVEGIVAWERRRDLMQQHSGEHIVSGLIHQLYGYNNVGFALGEDKMTADFDGVLSEGQVAQIEVLANEAIYKNIPITGKGYTQAEIEVAKYRSKKVLEGIIRLVDIPGYDCCACCGVHVQATGAIGMIKIMSADKHRGGTRLTLLCGARARKDYEMKHTQITRLMGQLSTKPEEVVRGVERLVEEKESLKVQVGQLKAKVFETKLHQEDVHQPLCLLEEGTPFDLRLFVNLWMERSEAPCLLLAFDGKGYKYALGQQGGQAGALAKQLHEVFNGKGGGKDIYQGALEGDFEAIHETFIRWSGAKYCKKV